LDKSPYQPLFIQSDDCPFSSITVPHDKSLFSVLTENKSLGGA